MASGCVNRASLFFPPVRMSQLSLRRDHVAQALLQLGELGMSPFALARPDGLPVHPHLEHAAGAGDERDLADLVLERGQQLLRRPARAQQPVTLGAELDLDAGGRLGRHQSKTAATEEWDAGLYGK